MPETISHEALERHWIHSHEEDTRAEMVFRPASFPFPPSRGRLGFELHADGSYVETGIGPTDKPRKADGSWHLEDENQLTIHMNVQRQPSRVMRVVSVSPERLVIRK
ncbi:MAG TPA: hypothetical protein VN688_07065 [Gemmataceae bacterium]|nr:hypothetical protein [Gemmataceae bacterium]